MPLTQHATVEFALAWRGADAEHTERVYYDKVSVWRDFFPGTLGEKLGELSEGESASQSFPAGELVMPWSEAHIHRVRPEQLHLQLPTGMEILPRAGRFYPRGMVAGLPDVFRGDRRPLRYLGEAGEFARVDLNHPLARHPLTVTGEILQALGTASERGGRSHDVAYDLTLNGPGMQVPHPEVATDFYSDEPFARLDERADTLFYRQSRLVQHLDATARGHITGIYARFLRPGMRVLDLMSSWVSHLPTMDLAVTGLGLNAEEMGQNPRLSAHVLHDLNGNPELPFADGQFDAAVCTASVEYLTQPHEVFRSVRRVLKPGAPVVIAFTDRWFPPKTIQVWPLLHAFERMGLVLDYFRRAGGFTALGTESLRDWPRPEDDAYAKTMAFSDPVFAVWGRAG